MSGEILTLESLQFIPAGSPDLDSAIFDCLGFDPRRLFADDPPVTSSIDAAVELIREKLPGYHWGVGYSSANTFEAEIWESGSCDGATAYGKTAPLALMGALLKTLLPIVQKENRRRINMRSHPLKTHPPKA